MLKDSTYKSTESCGYELNAVWESTFGPIEWLVTSQEKWEKSDSEGCRKCIICSYKILQSGGGGKLDFDHHFAFSAIFPKK